jgi:four helix bundle protein
MSYRDLEIWQLAREMSIEIHRMTLNNLPKFEMYEEGSQIRRSSKSIRSNIVEGYWRRRYKQDYIRFLCYAEASCDETTDHLETLFETGSLADKDLYETLHNRLRQLGRMINRFLSAVERKHQSPK